MTIKFLDRERLAWDKGGGLVPAIVQHWSDGRVLMLGYMNSEALSVTLETGKVTFYSRSKQRLWTKGESSGHFLVLKGLCADCDGDALLVLAEPHGHTCHRGRNSCFGDGTVPAVAFLGHLDMVVARRNVDRPDGSYTSQLFESGTHRIAQKVGEEGVEAALAAVAQDDEVLLGESADLLYHLLVLLRARGLGLVELSCVLQSRHALEARIVETERSENSKLL